MLRSRSSLDASVVHTDAGYRLEIQPSEIPQYRFAQLDDYALLARGAFPHRTVTLSIRSRVSQAEIPGTWGFGLWNDPFGLSLGFGGNPFRLPALPNSIWFFHASRENHLSFRNDKPANGMLAQVFQSPAFHAWLIPAGFLLPIFPRLTRKILSLVIKQETAFLNMDLTEWHDFELQLNSEGSSFWVDGDIVLHTPIRPNPPLGLVIWIDNQFAAFTPEGKIRFGILNNPEPAWMEVTQISLTK